MEIANKSVYDVLTAAGVTKIYHANSVLTACQFLREGALLSRGTVEQNGWIQTPQSSDDDDRKFGIWFDVFADSVDIHDRAKRVNVYGPVLFVLDAKILKNVDVGKVWVTKQNPTKWHGLKQSDRWFTSKVDLEAGFKYGEFDQMIVFRHCGGRLPLYEYLEQIVIDDPKAKLLNQTDLFSMAWGAVSLALAIGTTNLKPTIARRKCKAGCRCIEEYKADMKRTRLMFWPRANS